MVRIGSKTVPLEIRVELVDKIITTFKIGYMLEKSTVELVDKCSGSVLGLYLWKSGLNWLTKS